MDQDVHELSAEQQQKAATASPSAPGPTAATCGPVLLSIALSPQRGGKVIGFADNLSLVSDAQKPKMAVFGHTQACH